MTLDPTIGPGLEGRPTIRLERDLPHAIERVWRAVTEPAELAQWFVVPVEWGPEVGERFESFEQEVVVTQVDAPNVLAWSWGEERYRIELTATAAGTHLVFEHAFSEQWGPGEQHALGWQVYFGRLEALLDGHPVEELVAHDQAILLDDGGRPALRFFRRLEHPIERVWEAVTTPAGLAAWFPASVELDLRVGGAMRFEQGPDFASTGEVLELDPPRRFAFAWGDDHIRIDLIPGVAGETTSLSFLHVPGGAADGISKFAAGWHVCVDALVRAVGDPDAEPVATGRTPEWERHYEAYVARGYPSGAPIPAG